MDNSDKIIKTEIEKNQFVESYGPITDIFCKKNYKTPNLYIYPFNREETSILTGCLIEDEIRRKEGVKPVQIGDTIQILPTVMVLNCYKTSSQEPLLEHVIQNVYEFSFRPILKQTEIYENNGIVPDSILMEYLIEINDDFLMQFTSCNHINQPLEINQRYIGFGKFTHFFGNPFTAIPLASKEQLDTILMRIKVEKILDFDITHTWYKDETAHNIDLNDYQNFDKIKRIIAEQHGSFREIQTSKESALPTYYVSIS